VRQGRSCSGIPTVLGPNAAWYLDQLEDAVDHPQEANGPVAELTGSPAASVAQWAAQNAELFADSGVEVFRLGVVQHERVRRLLGVKL
jgi:hypothetical protein